MPKLLRTTLLLALVVPCAQAAPPRIGFLSGGDENNAFWNEVERFARAAAEDLGIEWVPVFPQETTYTIKRSGLRLLDRLNKGDYLITAYFRAVTDELLATAELRGVKVVIINTAIIEADRARLGAPRQKYTNWIGHLHPDDEHAGYLVADALIRAHRAREAAAQPMRMTALSGDPAVQVSFDRDRGRDRRLAEAGPMVKAVAAESALWTRDGARRLVAQWLDTLAPLHAVWAASDLMALGAIDAIEAKGLAPGRDVLVAGIDWTPDGLQAVADGRMVASVGGHFLEGGIAVVLIHDYHDGRDFAEELGVTITTPMYALDREGVARYRGLLGERPDWSRVDFRKLSKAANPALERYDFGWDRILAAAGR